MRRIRLSMLGLVLIGVLATLRPVGAAPVQAVAELLPKPAGWALSESAQEYLPGNLFEYIDGAAENFLSYEFARLALGQYKETAGPGEMTVEIYDMGTAENAFGIYASERVPESVFIPVGAQGYIEEGVLNFFAGKFYVKLLAYNAGDRTEPALRSFAAGILEGISEPGGFPLPVRAFPGEGLVANSEKFILQNFLGQAYLSRGYTAAYRRADMGDFSLFIIESGDAAGALGMLREIIAHFSPSGPSAAPTDSVVRFKDPYLGNVRIVPAGRFLCGAMKVRDGTESEGETIVLEMAKSISGK